MNKIKLGDKVKCKISGFIGIAISRTEYINGCVQYEVAETFAIDESSLEVIKPKEKEIIKEDNGGPMRKAIIQRGY